MSVMTHETLAATEEYTINAFIQDAARDGWLHGRVLDFGCGEQPYRGIIDDAGCRYEPWDLARFGGNRSRRDVGDPPSGVYEAIVCTQVLQYVADPAGTLVMLRGLLRDGGALLLTYPTAWPELRDELWRFTRTGAERMVKAAGFSIVDHRPRFAIDHHGFSLTVGYQMVACR